MKDTRTPLITELDGSEPHFITKIKQWFRNWFEENWFELFQYAILYFLFGGGIAFFLYLADHDCPGWTLWLFGFVVPAVSTIEMIIEDHYDKKEQRDES